MQQQSSNTGIIIIILVVVTCIIGIVYILSSRRANPPPVPTPTSASPSPASASTTDSTSAPVDTGITYKSNPTTLGSGTKVVRGVATCPAGSSSNAMDNDFFAKLLTELPNQPLARDRSTCLDKTTNYYKLHIPPPGIKPISCQDSGLLVLADPNGANQYQCVKCPAGTTQISADGYCMA